MGKMSFQTMSLGLIKHTFALGSSSFDMGSDVLNALNMLRSSQISENETLSSFGASMDNRKNTNTYMVIHEAYIDDIEGHRHQIWGALSISLIFLPGFVFWFPFMVQCIREREWNNIFRIFVAIFFFPVNFIVLQLKAIMMACHKQEVGQAEQTRITSMNSAEAALESTGQLLLQLYTLLNGYPSTTIQKITICTSFFQIARSIILQDIETKILINEEESLSFSKSLIETQISDYHNDDDENGVMYECYNA